MNLDHIPGRFKRLRRWLFWRSVRDKPYQFFKLGDPVSVDPDAPRVDAPRGGIRYIKTDDS